MEQNSVLSDVLHELYKICGKLRSLQNWQEEFYDRIQLKDPELVELVESQMGEEG